MSQAEPGGPGLSRRRQELPPRVLEGGARVEARLQDRPVPPEVAPKGTTKNIYPEKGES